MDPSLFLSMLHQSNDMISGLQDHIIVRSSYHHPGQILSLVLLITVNIHQSVDGQTKCPLISESSGEQL